MESSFDFVVVGGGLIGCPIASLLSKDKTSPSVALIEAGPDVYDNANVSSALGAFALHRTSVDWAYMTTSQSNLENRVGYNAAGKGLSGSSLMNYGQWTRGDRADYADWARVVQDQSWTYDALLPYFRKVENYHGVVNPERHGYEGPMHVATVSASSSSRNYPLRQPLRDAWAELGVSEVKDGNNGSPLGLSECAENFQDGKRQPSGKVYDLSQVRLFTNSMAEKILLVKHEGNVSATGVVLTSGNILRASKQVIICTGAHRTPQLLMLSGIGSPSELATHGIETMVEAPEVGKNYMDHFAVWQYWKLRHPETGLSMGSPAWKTPSFFIGQPCDFNVLESASGGPVHSSASTDNSRCDLKTQVIYAGASQRYGLNIPMDGSHIATNLMLTLPTSRGSIAITSASPQDVPLINPNCYATPEDRSRTIYGMRRLLHLFLDTKAGKEIVESETVPPECGPLNSNSTDEDIDARVRKTGVNFFHSQGSASMGRVVDTSFRVYGAHRLRVADASVVPVPIAANPQALLYALAERAAEMILHDN